MAAYIIRPNKKEWAGLKKILDEGGEGAIIITPAMQEWLEAQGVKAATGSLVDYDFGGEPDLMLDVMGSPQHYALQALEPDRWETLAEADFEG